MVQKFQTIDAILLIVDSNFVVIEVFVFITFVLFGCMPLFLL